MNRKGNVGRGFSLASVHKGLTDINFYIYAFIFRLDLSNLIEPNRKHSQSYVEDLAIEDWTKIA